MGLPGGEEGVFLDLAGSGMTEEGIAEMFPPPFYLVAYMDGKKVRCKAALMDAAAEVFGFPSYFGKNWDALLDCLRSLPEFNAARGYALVIRDSGAFLSDSPGDLSDFRDVAGTAAAFLREKLKIPFKVLFL